MLIADGISVMMVRVKKSNLVFWTGLHTFCMQYHTVITMQTARMYEKYIYNSELILLVCCVREEWVQNALRSLYCTSVLFNKIIHVILYDIIIYYYKLWFMCIPWYAVITVASFTLCKEAAWGETVNNTYIQCRIFEYRHEPVQLCYVLNASIQVCRYSRFQLICWVTFSGYAGKRDAKSEVCTIFPYTHHIVNFGDGYCTLYCK